MRRLNTAANILEVMGAPLTGTDVRAYVMSGGGITLKSFQPRLRSKRCFLIFPIHGSERKGLVSVEAKKKKGQVSFNTSLSNFSFSTVPLFLTCLKITTHVLGRFYFFKKSMCSICSAGMCFGLRSNRCTFKLSECGY